MIAAVLAGLAVLAVGWSWSPAARERAGQLGAPGADVAAAPSRARRRTRRPGTGNGAPDPTALAGWCDALSRAVRGGATLRQALADVPAPHAVAAHVDAIRLQLARGAALRVALEPRGGVPPHLDLVLVVLRACAEHGGAPGEPLDRAAAALRQRAALIAERRSQSAQAHLSAVVMTLLPGVLLAVLLVTSTSVRAALTGRAGLTVVALGATANAVGWWWMRRIIRGRGPWG